MVSFGSEAAKYGLAPGDEVIAVLVPAERPSRFWFVFAGAAAVSCYRRAAAQAPSAKSCSRAVSLVDTPSTVRGTLTLASLLVPRRTLGSLSNRALLVNNLLDLALYAGNTVYSSAMSPHQY